MGNLRSWRRKAKRNQVAVVMAWRRRQGLGPQHQGDWLAKLGDDGTGTVTSPYYRPYPRTDRRLAGWLVRWVNRKSRWGLWLRRR